MIAFSEDRDEEWPGPRSTFNLRACGFEILNTSGQSL